MIASINGKGGFTPLEMNESLSKSNGNTSSSITKKKRFLSLTGFTLVEIVISMLLLSTVVAGMLVVFVVGKRSVGMAGHKVEAISFAQETIDELRGRVGGYLWPTPDPTLNVGYHDSSTDPGICALPAGDFRYTFGGARSYTVVNEPLGSADGLERYKKVTVTVDWNEP